MCLSAGRTPPLAQSAAAGWSSGIHLKSSVQRQPEDSPAWRVGQLPVKHTFESRLCCTLRFSLPLCLGSVRSKILFLRRMRVYTGAQRGPMRAAAWVPTATLGTLRVLTVTPWSAGRSFCISWWVLPALLSARTWLSCWSKQAS